MLRKLLALTLVLGATAGITSLGSALFTDTAAVDANTFTTGSVNITTSPTTAMFTVANMAPGDVVYQPLTVANAGSLELRYDLTSVATNPADANLAGELQLTIKEDVTACTALGFATDGTVVSAAGDLGNIDGTTAITLDSDRVLAPAADEVLCFMVELPLTTTELFQGATTVATFTFTAEQTANND